ncbi:MAG: TIR domain-containing protein [Roseburia sp.]|nr:TIR domain-containing protein [Roseburia sp.]MCM1098150.1 TIR domain-containing protein [Ruminococcus flavefaciens]
MVRCSLEPYEGKEKYIFISYAHKDNDRVYPIIEKLAGMGYRIWYDEGIDPGSEWPETIAEHLNNCEVCIAFLSENYLNSHNCRREINFALRKKKSFITIVLEPVELSLGMEMQLSATQSVSKYTFPDDEAFYAKVCTAKFLSVCMAQPGERAEESRGLSGEEAKSAEKESERGGQNSEPTVEEEQASEREPKKTEESFEASGAEPKEAAKETQGTEVKDDTSVTLSKRLSPPNFVKKKRTENSTKNKKQDTQEGNSKKKKMLLMAGGAALLVLLIIVVSAVSGGGKVTVAGKEIKRSETSVTFSDVTITEEDVRNLASLEELYSLSFRRCRFEEGAADQLGSLSPALTDLGFTECTGIKNYGGLSELKTLTFLEIQSCGLTDQELGDVTFSDEIAQITLDGNAELSDLTPLKTASALWRLQVNNTSVTDFTALSSCTALRTLSADGCGIRDLSSLKGQGISYLSLADNEIESLSPLAGNETIRNLFLSGNRIEDISPLAGMTQLTVLELNDNAVASLAPLSGCAKLSTVRVSRNCLTSLNGLEQALELKRIEAAGNEITEIDGLQNCTILTHVDLTDNEISDISILAKSAATLEQVYLGGNQLDRIDALKGTAALTNLNLDGNRIVSLESLADSIELYGLSAEHNLITSTDGLENAVQLRYLYLAHNRIEDVEALEALTAKAEDSYYVLDISNNAISSLQLGGSINYNRLAVYGNPLTSLDFLREIKGTRLYFTYLDEAGTEGFGDTFTWFGILDCPADKQVATKNNIRGTVNFLTEEEAEADIAQAGTR